MQETGLVTEIKNNFATVRIDKKDECSKCGMCLFPKGAGYTEVSAINGVGAKQGDSVIIEMHESGKLLGAILVFLIPLLLIGVSAVIGLVIIKWELSVLILSLALIIMWYAVLAIVDKKLGKKTRFTHKIVRIKEKEND